MRTNRKILSALGLTVPFLIWGTAGCDDPFAQCVEGFDCPGDGEGPKSGGTSNSGGESNGTGSSDGSGGLAGGTSNSGGAGNSGGSSNPTGGNGSGGENLGGACGDNCTDEKPHCIEDEGTCVECTKHAHCEDPAKPVCGLKNTCDPCRTNADCKDVLGLTDTPVCVNDLGLDDFGKCVGCLTETDCGGAICELTTNTCIDGTIYKGKDVCEPCIDDRECMDGRVCVAMDFTDPTTGPVGTFCLWRRGATQTAAPKGTCGLNSRPYAKLLSVTTVNGEEDVEVCAPRSTTCTAIAHFSQPVSGCDAEGSDEACGAAGFNDGLCRLRNGVEPLCTYPCGGSDDSDCPKGFSCKAGGDRYCDL